jgi:hypothetical protein
VSHYIRHKAGVFELKSYEIPENDVVVSNISKNSSLEKAFHFIPGQKFILNVTPEREKPYLLNWEVQIDALNSTYLYCEKTRSLAYFRNDGDIHYFTHFEGDRDSLLFRFYLGAYKVMMGYYPNLIVNDQYPVNTFNNWFVALIQDCVAPFVLFSRSDYTLRYQGMEDAIMQTNIRLQSTITAKFGRRIMKSLTTDFLIGVHGLETFTIYENERVTHIKLDGHQ